MRDGDIKIINNNNIMKFLKTISILVIIIGIFAGIFYFLSEKENINFGDVSPRSNLEYATGTPAYLSTYLINGFTSTSTISFKGGESLRINIWGKPGTVTSTVGIMLKTSDDGINFSTLATTTDSGIYKGYTFPSYSFLPGEDDTTSTISIQVPKTVIGNANFIRASFNTTNLASDPNDGVNVYI